MTQRIRELHRRTDRAAVEAIDTSFETDVIFDLVTRERSITLEPRTLRQPITKRYAIDEVFAPWASWQRGWVVEVEGTVRGFATVEHVPWHQRLVLWFLYVGPTWRRQSIGRALLAEVEQYGREVGATHVWLETSNVNVPGVRAYERLGYKLCGVDSLYYGQYMPGESAIYLAKALCA
ncbi:MAG TPA: GNAT family N-acetyltransferase [Polyangiales bacterium]|nr:GNAT family N-acetyltransferase [Polyangiales bacterium]